MKDLNTYLAANGVTQSALADRLGITQGMVAHLVNGRSEASPELALAIERETGVDATTLSPRLKTIVELFMQLSVAKEEACSHDQ